MEAVFPDASFVKAIFESISSVLNDVQLRFEQSGLSMTGLDDSAATLVRLKMSSNMFSRYQCKKELHVRIHLKHFLLALRCHNSGDAVTLKENGDKITMILHSSRDHGFQLFDLALLEMKDDHPLEVPTSQFLWSADMSSAELAKTLKDMSQFGDVIEIGCSSECVEFKCSGIIGHVVKKLPTYRSTGNRIARLIRVNHAWYEKFNARFLMQIIKGCSVSERARISLSRGHPLCIKFPLKNGSTLADSLEFFIAPRVRDED